MEPSGSGHTIGSGDCGRGVSRADRTLSVTLLGTGAAERIPSPACICPSCVEARRDPRLRRKYAKALVTAGATRVLIDCGSDLDHRALPRIDGVLLTHFHFDHVLGLHRLGWSLSHQRRIPLVHAREETVWGLRGLLPVMNGAARLAPRSADPFRSFHLSTLEVTPLPLSHGVPCLGYLLEAAGHRIAYLTDTRGLPRATADFLAARPIDVAVVDCTFPPGNGKQDQHNDLDSALQSLDRLSPEVGILTHVSHRNWPYSAMAPYTAHADDRWIVGLDGTSAEIREGEIRMRHPAQGRREWVRGPAAAGLAPCPAVD